MSTDTPIEEPQVLTPLERLQRLAQSVQAAMADLRQTARSLNAEQVQERCKILKDALDSARVFASELSSAVGQEREKTESWVSDIGDAYRDAMTLHQRKHRWETRIEPRIRIIKQSAKQGDALHRTLRAKRREMSAAEVLVIKEEVQELHRATLEANGLLAGEEVPLPVRRRLEHQLKNLERALTDSASSYERKRQWEAGQATNAAAIEVMVAELEAAAAAGATPGEIRQRVGRVASEIERRRPLSVADRRSFEGRVTAIGADIARELAHEQASRKKEAEHVRQRMSEVLKQLEPLVFPEPEEEPHSPEINSGAEQEETALEPEVEQVGSPSPEALGSPEVLSPGDVVAEMPSSKEQGSEAKIEAGGGELPEPEAILPGAELKSSSDEQPTSLLQGEQVQVVEAPETQSSLESEGAEGDRSGEVAVAEANKANNAPTVPESTSAVPKVEDKGGSVEDAEATNPDKVAGPGVQGDTEAEELANTAVPESAVSPRAAVAPEKKQAPPPPPPLPPLPQLSEREMQRVENLQRELKRLLGAPVIGWGERRRLEAKLRPLLRQVERIGKMLKERRLADLEAKVALAFERSEKGNVKGVLRQIQDLQRELKRSELSKRQRERMRKRLREAWGLAVKRIEDGEQERKQKAESGLRVLAGHYERWLSRVDGLDRLIHRLKSDLIIKQDRAQGSTSIGYKVLAEQFRVKSEQRIKELEQTQKDLIRRIEDVGPKLKEAGYPWPEEEQKNSEPEHSQGADAAPEVGGAQVSTPEGNEPVAKATIRAAEVDVDSAKQDSPAIPQEGAITEGQGGEQSTDS